MQTLIYGNLKRGITVAATAILASAALIAIDQKAVEAIELWKGFYSGMSKEQIKSRSKEKLSCNEKEGTEEWCHTRYFLPLGNSPAKATFMLESNKLARITLVAKTSIDSCPKRGSYSWDEIKARKDCEQAIERTDGESLRVIQEALTAKYGKAVEKEKTGSLVWRSNGTLIRLVYLATGLYYVTYEADKTYGSI